SSRVDHIVPTGQGKAGVPFGQNTGTASARLAIYGRSFLPRLQRKSKYDFRVGDLSTDISSRVCRRMNIDVEISRQEICYVVFGELPDHVNWTGRAFETKHHRTIHSHFTDMDVTI